jgi:hypothetical protein
MSHLFCYFFMNHGARLRGLIGDRAPSGEKYPRGDGDGGTFPANITGDEHRDILLLRGAKSSADPREGYPCCHP